MRAVPSTSGDEGQAGEGDHQAHAPLRRHLLMKDDPGERHGGCPAEERGTSQDFVNVTSGERKGHRSWRGGVLWVNDTYSDNRVLLHIPKGYNANKPGVMVVASSSLKATARAINSIGSEMSAGVMRLTTSAAS